MDGALKNAGNFLFKVNVLIQGLPEDHYYEQDGETHSASILFRQLSIIVHHHGEVDECVNEQV